MDALKTKPNKPLSQAASQLLQLLKRRHQGIEKAITDEELSTALGVHKREVVDIAGELLDAGFPVLATCNRTKPGRYLSSDTSEIREHGKNLIKRGIKIIRRGRAVRRAAEKMDAEKKVEPVTGQMRMFT